MYRLLIVEDEKLIADGIAEILKNENLHLLCVDTAYTAQNAIEMFQKTSYDIILSDIRMPEMDGLKMIHILRDIRPSIKVLFLTGYRDFEFAREALRLQVIDYFLKPVEDEVLLQTIQKIIDTMENEVEMLVKQRYTDVKMLQFPHKRIQKYFYEVLLDQRSFSEKCRQRDFLANNIDLDPAKNISTILVFYKNSGGYSVEECHCMLIAALIEKYSFTAFLCGLQATVLLVEGNPAIIGQDILNMQSQYPGFAQMIHSIQILESSPWDIWRKKILSFIANIPISNEIQESYQSSMPDAFSDIINLIQKYIQEHLDQDLSLTALSIKFHINPSYLSRLFHQTVGEPFSIYVTNRRIYYAKKMLKDSEYRIQEISKLVGFDNPNYFSKVFREQTGMTPKSFKKYSTKSKTDPSKN